MGREAVEGSKVIYPNRVTSQEGAGVALFPHTELLHRPLGRFTGDCTPDCHGRSARGTTRSCSFALANLCVRHLMTVGRLEIFDDVGPLMRAMSTVLDSTIRLFASRPSPAIYLPLYYWLKLTLARLNSL